MKTFIGKRARKAVESIIALSLVFSLVFAGNYQISADTPAGETPTDPQAEEGAVSQPQKFGKSRVAYSEYLILHSDKPSPPVSVEVDIFNGITDSANTETRDSIAGSPAVLSGEDGYVEWIVDIAEEGLYNIFMEYYPVNGRGIDIERTVFINGEMPFTGADIVPFPRVWVNGSEIKQDNRGNDIRPPQIEAPRWESSYFMDSMGYYTEPYKFYFKKGENRIRLDALNESVAIRKLVVENKPEIPSYNEMINSINKNDYSNAPQGFVSIVQGEEADYRSSPSLYPIYDRSSPATEPYSIDRIKLNMIGGNNWRIPGQWIEWEIEVPENGLYNLSFKERQNYLRGNVSCRTLTIDGETPFNEVSVVPFEFTGDWNMYTISDNEGNPYLFPLTKGKHVIRLEVTLGEMGGFLSRAAQSVNNLTEAYRKILVLVGTTPDPYRDYQVNKAYPEVMEYFKEEAKNLYELVDDVTAYTGQKGDKIAAAQTVAKQLERFLAKPDTIPKAMINFKINIGALGNFVLSMSESPLDIDYLVVSTPETALPKVKTGFFSRAAHEIKSFFTSFFVDYSSIGNVYDNNSEPIEVWMMTGRDQSQSLKTIIDDTFTPEYGISVNIRLVAANALLPAVVAGTGPDIALQVASSEPVNFALRNSAVDLSKMEGFDEVKSKFFDSSFEPYKFNGGIYGLPETQSFYMLFYREDILEQLGLEVPQTWDDVIKSLTILQKNNMDFGLAPDELLTIYVTFLTQLYQRGGTVYNEEGSAVLLDNAESIGAFEFLTQMYSHYKLQKIYKFEDRFRTGEMPMGVADYQIFNTLSVSAPEIRGLWNFTVMPGYVDENGVINRQTTGGGLCSMMYPAANNKEDAWTFLKWWISADTQVRFGREMECLMGAAARYATANTEAFERLAWSSAQRKVLLEQWQWVTGTPEVPGGYYTSRHVLNAFRKVVNKNEEPRETLLDYTRTINDELHKKRKEFGLEQ